MIPFQACSPSQTPTHLRGDRGAAGRVAAALPFLALLGLVLPACVSSETKELRANKELVHRFVEAANEHDFDELMQVVDPNLRRHSQSTPGVDVRSAEDLRRFLEADTKTFPDARMTLQRIVAEDVFVSFQGTFSATQKGPIGPYPATDKPIEIDCSGTFRIQDGRIAELWIVWDNLAMLTQLGHFSLGAPYGEE